MKTITDTKKITKERNEHISRFLNRCKESDTLSLPWLGNSLHKDWEVLMESLELIKKKIRSSDETKGAKIGEYFLDRFDMGRKLIHFTLIQWTNNGWRMAHPPKDKELSIYYIVGENCKTYKEGLFFAISDLCKLLNKNVKTSQYREVRFPSEEEMHCPGKCKMPTPHTLRPNKDPYRKAEDSLSWTCISCGHQI